MNDLKKLITKVLCFASALFFGALGHADSPPPPAVMCAVTESKTECVDGTIWSESVVLCFKFPGEVPVKLLKVSGEITVPESLYVESYDGPAGFNSAGHTFIVGGDTGLPCSPGGGPPGGDDSDDCTP